MFSLITEKNISIPESLNALYLNAQAAIASSIFCLSVVAIPNSLSDLAKRDQWFITLQVTEIKALILDFSAWREQNQLQHESKGEEDKQNPRQAHRNAFT